MAETLKIPGTKPGFDVNFLFGQLVEKLKGRPPKVQQRISAHIKSKGHNSLVAYHNNGASTEEKIETYRTCLRAVLAGDYSGLVAVDIPARIVTVPTPAPKPEPEPP